MNDDPGVNGDHDHGANDGPKFVLEVVDGFVHIVSVGGASRVASNLVSIMVNRTMMRMIMMNRIIMIMIIRIQFNIE